MTRTHSAVRARNLLQAWQQDGIMAFEAELGRVLAEMPEALTHEQDERFELLRTVSRRLRSLLDCDEPARGFAEDLRFGLGLVEHLTHPGKAASSGSWGAGVLPRQVPVTPAQACHA